MDVIRLKQIIPHVFQDRSELRSEVALERPAHVNIDSMTVRPRAQASNTLVAREG